MPSSSCDPSRSSTRGAAARRSKLRCVDLFSGCGGVALGLKPFCDVVAYCDNNEACAATLRNNMANKRLDAALALAPRGGGMRGWPAGGGAKAAPGGCLCEHCIL